MITPFDIWLISTANSVIGLLFFITVVSALTSAAAGIVFVASNFYKNEYELDKYLSGVTKSILKLSVPTLLVSLILLTAIPSSKTLAAMYVIPKIANSDIVQKDLTEATQAIVRLAKDWAEKEIGPGKEAADCDSKEP